MQNQIGRVDTRRLVQKRLATQADDLTESARRGNKNRSFLDLTRPMSEIRELLSACSVGTRLKLTGPLIVARAIAHAKIKERLDAGGEMPRYMRDHAVYYAGPAKTPDGMASGSFGPTTAGRMDSYVDAFQAAGGSMVMLAKGNRSAQVTRACKKHGGFYLGSIGGPAAILAQNNIKKVDVLEFSELGMEAIWKIEVEDFPAFVIGTTRATTSSRSGRPEGTRVRVTLVAKLFLGYRLRTTREANKSPSDVSRCASAAGIADLGVSSPAASSKREDARVICPPHPQVEDLRDDRAVVADGGGESRDGGLHRGALGLVHVPHGGLVLGLWSRLKRPGARDVEEVRQERVVGEDGWVEDDADRLGVAVTVAHAIVRGRWGVPARVSHPSSQDPSELAKDELRTPESSASEVRDGGLFGLRRGGRRGASRGDDADAMRGRAVARGDGGDRRGGD